MTFKIGYTPYNKGKHLSQNHRNNISKALKEYWKTHNETLEKARQGRLKYYQANEVWNKGLSWSSEIREKIREGCLNSEIGMGPKSQEEIIA